MCAVGSSWSFSDIAESPDYLVETDQLTRVLSTIVPGALNAAGRALKLVHVEAGIKVMDLCSVLDSMGLALSTMGGSDGQSLGVFFLPPFTAPTSTVARSPIWCAPSISSAPAARRTR